MDRIPVIIDTDPGVDDTVALKMALEDPRLDVRLVCSTAGNVNIDDTTANALYIVRTFGGSVRVARGVGKPLYRELHDAADVHGAKGLGGFAVPQNDYRVDDADAVDAMHEVLSASETGMTLITLGPMTNIAALLMRYPDAAKKIRSVYAMIASVDGSGNVTPYAEFNAYCDPEALQTVLHSGLDLVFAPMQLGTDTRIAQKDILRAGQGTQFGQMLCDIFSGYHESAAGEEYLAMYDANAVFALSHPEYYRFVRCTAQVDINEYPGRTVLAETENGPFRYLTAKENDALAAAMLAHMF